MNFRKIDAIPDGLRLPKGPYYFLDEVLVECPRCRGMAVVRKADETEHRSGLTCSACGYAPERLPKAKTRGTYQGVDFTYGLPLWLSTTMGRETVWAYNWRHFEDLEFFAAGNWRAYRHRHPESETRRTFQCRLPGWMHEEKSKADLLRALRRIKAKRG